MKKFTLYLSLIVSMSLSGYAQNPYTGNVYVIFDENNQNRETVLLKARIDLSNLHLGKNEMITFTPALRSLDGSRQINFDPFTLYGKQRYKVLQREAYFLRQMIQISENSRIITGKNTIYNYHFNLSAPFEKWMMESQMIIIEHTGGCCDDSLMYADGNRFKIYENIPYVFPEPYHPNFTISYMAAIAGEAKIMQETYSAQLNFRVNQIELLRQFGNNEHILSEADQIINRIKNDSLLAIRKILVRGYASPEGNAVNNQRLSEGRARAFVSYLHSRHNFYQADRMIVSEGHGEDWPGLRKAVEERDYLEGKEQVLNIIDNTYDPERRKVMLKSVASGRTYRIMLDELYPPLRRNEYTIEYEVRGFSAEEARIIFLTRPQLLSLEEMFMVANLYENDSEEYKQVFDVAARLFPDSGIAQFNVGAMEIENGSYDTAIRRLEKFNTPEASNNLGIAYWFKGEYDKARQYLHQAADSGSQQATRNLTEFDKWFEDWKQE